MLRNNFNCGNIRKRNICAGGVKLPEEKISATKYKNDFQKEKYDRIIVNVPKGQRDVIKDKATQLGYKSLNSFVVDAINEKLEK